MIDCYVTAFEERIKEKDQHGLRGFQQDQADWFKAQFNRCWLGREISMQSSTTTCPLNCTESEFILRPLVSLCRDIGMHHIKSLQS